MTMMIQLKMTAKDQERTMTRNTESGIRVPMIAWMKMRKIDLRTPIDITAIAKNQEGYAEFCYLVHKNFATSKFVDLLSIVNANTTILYSYFLIYALLDVACINT